MAVSKRLRYEILRRDNHTCRYCGRTAPSVPLRVDHVVPVALGGTDDPTNLVTSCEPCNSGKTSTVPDSPLVAQVREDAMRWQMAWAVAVAEAETEGKQRAKDIAKVKKNYVAAYKGRHKQAPILPEGWEASVGRWLDLGLPLTLIDKAIASAVGRTYVPAKDRFAYFAGCCWSLLRELKDRTEVIAKQASPATQDEQGDGQCEYCDGGQDDRNIVEYAKDVFAEAWSQDEEPNSYCRRMLAAYASAASGAGYDRLSIGYAVHQAARDGHADIGAYLLTLNDVLERASEPIIDSPFESRVIDADLLPTDEDRAARAVAEAVVAAWRASWRDAMEHPPPGRHSTEACAVRDYALAAYRETENARELLRAAEFAGAEGSSNLPQAIVHAEAYYATEPAVSAWGWAWYKATGLDAPGSVHESVWANCRALHASGVWDHKIILAASFAGAHATTRMHFGLNADEAELIGVEATTQRIEDFWARSWNESSHSWPGEEDRAALRACLSSIADDKAHTVGDVTAAAVAAGAYQSADLYPSLTRALSTFEAAANLPVLGGA